MFQPHKLSIHLSKLIEPFGNWLISGLTLEEWWAHAKIYGTTSPVTNRAVLGGIFLILAPLVLVGSLTGRLQDNLSYIYNAGKIGTIDRRFEGPRGDLPAIFTAIARCESGGSQYDPYGQVVRGRINQHDVGLYQINEVIHQNAINQTGIDIYTKEGNSAFASYLYNIAGLYPWRSSRSCWERYLD